MTVFTARTSAEAVVAAPRQAIWDALTDPDTLASLTPFLKRITPEGDSHWRWEMTGLDVLPIEVAPVFTEKMEFVELERIDFHHDPPAGRTERTAVTGWYVLKEVEGGTHLATSLEIALDLPLPKLSSKVVTTAMRGVIDQMGDRFSRNLLDHLGIDPKA
ncbi:MULTISPECIES: CoxG family protein [Nocardioides]|uniref:CoxG family protein n=1 Tax=Nocardioides TaxID=1839 RepID=UPI000703AC16|nr:MULTISPECIES: SRPBCC family protein [unclassified Nocardioides]KQP63707.1 hypothetical protein ASF47_17045 [Nocardioides sp. Leaf285]MBJ7529191.1 SRPBCC family protein [Nocardioides sp.]MCM3516502.1 SRPBCC family protein [Nocardioides sp. P86]